MKQPISWRRRLAMACMVAFFALQVAAPAFADNNVANNGNNSDVCTNFAQGLMNLNGNNAQGNQQGGNQQNDQCQNGQDANGQACSDQGLLSDIYVYIKSLVSDATEKLFNAFVENDSYQAALAGAVTLTIVIFGAAFTMGVMQVSFGQVLVRLLKIAIIFLLISASGWEFFNGTMVHFFNDGTDELVKGVMEIGTGIHAPPGATPFYQLDKLAAFIIQPDTLIAIMGAFFAGGPFSLMMGGMMALATAGFISLVVKALRLYAVAYVARALLLGLAPVFFVFLLFERTKNLFMSWLNALLTMSLQPILLFTFLSFFMVLIQTAATDMFHAELCWTEFKSSVDGSQSKPAFWRFVDPDTHSPIMSDMDWKGAISCRLNNGTNCKEFPINIMDVMSFLILIYLAVRFADSIERIANELSNAYLLLDTGGRLDQFFQQQQSQGGVLSRGVNTQAGGQPPPRTTRRP